MVLPLLCDSPVFVIAVSHIAVNLDGGGGAAPDPTFLDHGCLTQRGSVDVRDNVEVVYGKWVGVLLILSVDPSIGQMILENVEFSFQELLSVPYLCEEMGWASPKTRSAHVSCFTSSDRRN